MPASLVDGILEKLKYAHELYHRLILVVAPAGAGKTAALQEICGLTGAPLVNVNLELSRLMLQLTERQRTLQLPRLFSDVLGGVEGDVVLLDNIEILFDPLLKQDPLRLLQSLSRSRTLVVSWNGAVNQGFLTYAVPEHPEYRRYSVKDLLLVTAEPAV
jgi:ABC-type hemin transport system ATPase subunit